MDPNHAASKLRLMCSHGGRIVPRPHDKSLCYAGGETRIVAIDRRTTTASLAALSAHLSRSIFHSRPFRLKYQLPNETLDSLISVVNDEDLVNMLDEHDRINPPGRIRLFLFPIDSEVLDSRNFDLKSESWICDAAKSTGILSKGADSGVLKGVVSDFSTAIECGEDKQGQEAESLVLETNLSFRSTSSSNSMSNSPPIGIVQCEDNGGNLLERKVRVPSSASIDSDSSVGSATLPLKTGICQEPLVQVAPETSSFHIESESSFSEHSSNILASKTGEVLGYPLSQWPDGKQLQQETQYIQGGLHYIPQYAAGPMPISPYYPVYQMPVHQPHMHCPTNLQYPVYLVPAGSTQYHNMSMKCNFIDSNASSCPSRPPLHPQTATVVPSVTHKEVFGAQAVTEFATSSYRIVADDTPLVNTTSSQDPLMVPSHEPAVSSEPVTTSSVVSAMHSGDFEEDFAYNPIYKTQPPPPALASQYCAMTAGATLLFSESSV